MFKKGSVCRHFLPLAGSRVSVDQGCIELPFPNAITMVIGIRPSGNIAPLCDSHTLGLWRV